MIAQLAAPALAPAPRRPARRPSWRRAFLIDNLDLIDATGVTDARWEAFQIDHLDDEGTFRIETKSRQIAWSWISAAEAIAEAHADLWGDQPRDSIFVSIKTEEAAEKIRYARRVYDSLKERSPIGSSMHRITRDGQLHLEFSNGARLNSLPAVPPRGRARANVYLDEFAHVAQDREIYTAALPIISKGGRLRIGSSPFGAAGSFWELFSQAIREYPGYTRRSTPWWKVAAFCTNVPQAIRMAPQMEPTARIAMFGNDRIKAIFANMDLDDFRQEYEAAFVDEARSYFPWAEIKAIQRPELWHQQVKITGADIRPAFAAIDKIARAIQEGDAEEVLIAGYDVGRTRDASELTIIGLSPAGAYPARGLITLEKTPYTEQGAVIGYALDVLPIARLWIDRNGIGNQLAEEAAADYPGRADGYTFSQPSKTLLATNAKMLIQQRRFLIPPDRDLAYQIHSIKKIVTPAKMAIFDSERTEKHHADKFWAAALALAAAHAGAHTASADALQDVFNHL